MMIIPFLLLVCAAVSELPPAPNPSCSSRPILPKLPLTLSEILTVDLSPYFQGYNLDMFLAPNQFASLTPKYVIQASRQINLPGQVVNYHLKHKDNQWSDEFMIISEEGNKTTLLYGLLKNKHEIPYLEKNVTIEEEQNSRCYDAVRLQDQKVIVVDCARITPSGYSNYFVLVDDQTGEVVKRVNNSLYAPFTEITKRKVLRYYENQTGYDYLLRVYLADGVDEDNSNNTYLEIIKAVDMDLESVGVIDYTSLGWSTLSIMDATIYKNQIFILDYDSGLLRLAITPRGIFITNGLYFCQFFSKFAVYSDDMNEQLLVAVANRHTVHEIMWSNNKPSLITKYSLIRNSTVSKLQINRNYLIVQSSSQVQTQQQFEAVLNYTWVFIRGSRIYTNAYKVFSHKSPSVFIDLNLQDSYIMMMNRTHILNMQLMRPILTLNSENITEIHQSSIVISVVSSDFINPNVIACTKVVTVSFVEKDNMAIWPGGSRPSQELFMNYPGQLLIQLDNYVIGPNITFEYKSLSQNTGDNYVLKQNQTKLLLGFNVSQAVTLLHTDVSPMFLQNSLQLYVQDKQNNTYISSCVNPWSTSLITCTLKAHYKHPSSIFCFTTASYTTNYNQLQYLYIFSLTNSKHVIKLFVFDTSQSVGEIRYPEGMEGQIGDLHSNHGVLYVTLPIMKRVDVYRLGDCDGVECKLYISLTAQLMKTLGVQYFAPKRIHTVAAHQKVVFIQCLDEIVIVDLFNKQQIRVLSELSSKATTNLQGYKIALNKDYIVIVSSPDTIEQYRMVDLYGGVIKYHKNLPLYNYYINRAFDLQFNDKGNLFYLTVRDLSFGFRSVVLVYRLGTTYVNSLFDTIYLPGEYNDFELEVSGGYVDFVTIIKDRNFTTLKEYEHPVMVLENEDRDLSFYLEARNTKDLFRSKVAVTIANYPDNFNKSKGFPSSTATYFTQKIKDRYTWSDHNWFEGHILGYYHKCTDCPKKLTFESHMLELKQLDLQAEDYYRSLSGGFFLWEDVFRLHLNGTVRSIETLPKPNKDSNEVCRKIIVDPTEIYVISVCSSDIPDVNIYLTSYASRKGFTLGPWRSEARAAVNLQIVNGLMMLTDVEINLEAQIREGAVYLYVLNLEGGVNKHFIELQVIDTNDLSAAHNYPGGSSVFIGNSHLVYNAFTGKYTLYITQTRYGLFVVTFQWIKGFVDINVEAIQFLDINTVLNSYNLHMPSDAIFVGVTSLQTQNVDSPVDVVVVTSRNFHSFELRITYSKGKIAFCSLAKVYYRYGYYQLSNTVKAYNGYLVLPYIIPPIAQVLSNFSRQVIGLYDTTDYPDDDSSRGYKGRYIIAGHTIDTKTPTSFDFNQTYRSQGDVLGLVITDPKNRIISENKISKNLSIIVKDENFLTQNMYLWPYSDFYQLMFELTVIGDPDRSLTGWQIFFIVFGSILALVAMFFFGRYLLAKWKLYRKKTYLLEEDQGSGEEEEEQAIPNRINASERGSLQQTEGVRNTLNQPLLPEGYSAPGSLQPTEYQPQGSEINRTEVVAEPPAGEEPKGEEAVEAPAENAAEVIEPPAEGEIPQEIQNEQPTQQEKVDVKPQEERKQQADE